MRARWECCSTPRVWSGGRRRSVVTKSGEAAAAAHDDEAHGLGYCCCACTTTVVHSSVRPTQLLRAKQHVVVCCRRRRWQRLPRSPPLGTHKPARARTGIGPPGFRVINATLPLCALAGRPPPRKIGNRRVVTVFQVHRVACMCNL